MSSAATTAPWMGSRTDSEPTELLVTLVDGETVSVPLGNWDAETLVIAIFREGFVRVRSTGTIRYISASQIKEITPGGKDDG